MVKWPAISGAMMLPGSQRMVLARERNYMKRFASSPVWLMAALLATCTPSVDSGGADVSCRWRVVGTREARPSDVPFVQRHPRLARAKDSNTVPGPDSLRIHVRTSSDYKASIFLDDPATGRSEFLTRGSAPRPSRDGRSLAYIRWDSTHRPWTLVVMDLKTKQQTVPDLDGCASEYEWSSDGKWIAVMATPCQQRMSRLCLVAMPSCAVRWVDSLEVFSDYEFSWSPDSRWLAVARPTAIDEHTEEPTASDLWLIGINGQRCQLPPTADYVEHDPQWIDARAVRVSRSHVATGAKPGVDRVVLTLRKE